MDIYCLNGRVGDGGGTQMHIRRCKVLNGIAKKRIFNENFNGKSSLKISCTYHVFAGSRQRCRRTIQRYIIEPAARNV